MDRILKKESVELVQSKSDLALFLSVRVWSLFSSRSPSIVSLVLLAKESPIKQMELLGAQWESSRPARPKTWVYSSIICLSACFCWLGESWLRVEYNTENKLVHNHLDMETFSQLLGLRTNRSGHLHFHGLKVRDAMLNKKLWEGFRSGKLGHF